MPRIRSFPIRLEIGEPDFEVARAVGEMSRLNRRLQMLRPDKDRTIEIDDLLFKESDLGAVPVGSVSLRGARTLDALVSNQGSLAVSDCRTSGDRSLITLAGNLWANIPALQSKDGRHGAPVLLNFEPANFTTNIGRGSIVLPGIAIMGSPFLNSGSPTVEETEARLKLAHWNTSF